MFWNVNYKILIILIVYRLGICCYFEFLSLGIYIVFMYFFKYIINIVKDNIFI